jgi:predicted Zn-ribbon and HTH transcriptional regulator
MNRQYKSFFTHDWGGFRSTDELDRPAGTIYFIAIIDMLQPYNLKKQLEHSLKSIKYDSVRALSAPATCTCSYTYDELSSRTHCARTKSRL